MTHRDTEMLAIPELTPVKLKVLLALFAGKAVASVAQKANVSRETNHRWLREDDQFQAAYNRGRLEMLAEIQSVLLDTARSAADLVSDTVRSGDVKAALVVIKGLGGLSGSSTPMSGRMMHRLWNMRRVLVARRRRHC